MTINRSNEGRMIKPGLGRGVNDTDAESADEGLSDMDNTMGGEDADESMPQIGGAPTTSVDPSAVSMAKEETGPATKVLHGRPAPKGKVARASGSTIGPGSEGGNHGRNTMGHGERSASSGNTMGHKK